MSLRTVLILVAFVAAAICLPLQSLWAESDTTKASVVDPALEPDASSPIGLPYDREIVGGASLIQVAPNKDTIVTTSGYGDLWFGLFGGANLGTYLGDLNLATRRSEQLLRSGRDFGSGTSAGYFFGGLAEWKRPEWRWGFGLSISFVDVRDGAFEEVVQQTAQAEFGSETRFSYVTVSPMARFDLLKGLYVFGGLDFEFTTDAEAFVIPQMDTSAFISQRNRVDIDAHGFRVGVQVGVSYEFLMLEVAESARVRFAPFLSLHYGSEVSDNLSSDLSLGFMRLGASVKVSKNNTQRIIRRFDPEYQEPPVLLASLPQRFDFEIPSLRPDERITAVQLAVIERPVVVAPVDTVTVDTEVIASSEIRTPRPPRSPIELASLNEEHILGIVGGALSAELTEGSYAYLDEVAKFLKQNPSVEAQIAGYTDNFGTPEETQRVSELRASHVVRYLEGQGISQSRLFPSGLGARSAIANNVTEEGRRRNRRVAITLIE